ncbi:MAG: DUF4058 family protein [Chloroflexota bacterium]
MKTPFPGMDPYLEHRALWPDVHNSLITAIRDAIVPLVAPNYYVGVESRAYVIRADGDAYLGRPDVAIISPIATQPSSSTKTLTSDVSVLEVDLLAEEEVNHYYLEVRSVHTNELVTVIELLSPANKIDIRGRRDYSYKRSQILVSLSNLVEIDLLRIGRPMPTRQRIESDYRILLNRGWIRGKGQLYAFNLPTPIPEFPLPLLPDDTEPLIPLNQIVHDLYTRARFDLRIDYSQMPSPPLSKENEAWIQQLLAA